MSYYTPQGGLPPQTALLTDRAVVKPAYTFIPKGVLRDIVTFQPGGSIPFAETHVMEHGLYVLQGKAVYRLIDDWVECEAGDYMLLRAFCPQACYAGGPEPFRYLLYKDVNRQIRLT